MCSHHSCIICILDGNPIKAKFKGCVPSNTCLYPNISTAVAALFCCNKDLCNAKDAGIVLYRPYANDHLSTIKSTPILLP